MAISSSKLTLHQPSNQTEGVYMEPEQTQLGLYHNKFSKKAENGQPLVWVFNVLTYLGFKQI